MGFREEWRFANGSMSAFWISEAGFVMLVASQCFDTGAQW